MAGLTTAWVQAHPSMVVPEILMQYNQPSGVFEAFAGSAPEVKIGSEDLTVYVRRLDIRTATVSSAQAPNQLPSVSINANLISTPTYLVRTRAEFDHHDTAQAGNWGFSLPEAQRLGMRQGIFQQMRLAGLYGMNPSNGEGLMNASGATTTTLPADTFGNTTIQTYDNGQMALYLLGLIAAIKIRTYQTGVNQRVVILGPQRVLALWQYVGIVQLTSFQRPGGGSATVGGTVENILEMSGDTIQFAYDDTLIGKGSGGKDAIIITLPEIELPKQMATQNTNEFAKLTPSHKGANMMYCDMAAPREIPTPIPGGALDIVSELRITSGWGLRPEAITILSATY
ncbi:MAG TPA: hypothetical protein VFM18_09125 [Methanosarcina sp.]|nr:hypothetical protein [Methanosarcina sp.]